ncbi:MAG TPA: pyridoxamine 5'-phosphate oxidase family protein [Puia sp.]|nr:pyridoxamine 5'-phosphate oxidase family protein [Puia sp.]
MLGTLTMPEIEKLLRKEVVGRIGCSDGKMMYVVPISYVYDGDSVFCHSHEGLKVQIMREHPTVCFEVDHMQNMGNWQSVISHGQFEELTDPAQRNAALQKLHERILPVISSETTHLSPDWPFPPAEFDKIEGVTFRIRLEDKSGRFERSHTLFQSFFSI